MAELLLDSLEIKGYRCFEHLTIEKFGRVNLIVGKNNVGKTSLLEILRIYVQDGRVSLLQEILEARKEISRNIKDFEDLTESFSNLFFKRSFDAQNQIQVGESLKDKNKISIKIGYKNGSLKEQLPLQGIPLRDIYDSENLVLTISKGKNEISSIPLLNENFRRFLFMADRRNESKVTNLQFVQANGLGENEVATLWDHVVLTELENFTTQALRIIAPEILRISFRGEENRNLRIPIAKMEDNEKPLSLRSLGEGMSRILGISLSLANSKNGMLIIDEIESGLHYSVLPDVWKLIFKTAKDLNVQVFATTHSKDCIEAFTQAAVDDEESEGMLIRLVRKDDKIKAFTFDEKELKTVKDDDIEVR